MSCCEFSLRLELLVLPNIPALEKSPQTKFQTPRAAQKVMAGQQVCGRHEPSGRCSWRRTPEGAQEWLCSWAWGTPGLQSPAVTVSAAQASRLRGG